MRKGLFWKISIVFKWRFWFRFFWIIDFLLRRCFFFLLCNFRRCDDLSFLLFFLFINFFFLFIILFNFNGVKICSFILLTRSFICFISGQRLFLFLCFLFLHTFWNFHFFFWFCFRVRLRNYVFLINLFLFLLFLLWLLIRQFLCQLFLFLSCRLNVSHEFFNWKTLINSWKQGINVFWKNFFSNIDNIPLFDAFLVEGTFKVFFTRVEVKIVILADHRRAKNNEFKPVKVVFKLIDFVIDILYLFFNNFLHFFILLCFVCLINFNFRCILLCINRNFASL